MDCFMFLSNLDIAELGKGKNEFPKVKIIISLVTEGLEVSFHF